MSEMAERITKLAESFPTLRGVKGVRPWDPILLERQLGSPARTHASGQAILFVLSVWNTGFTSGTVDLFEKPFDMHSALMAWDDNHLAAFQAWASNPWWA